MSTANTIVLQVNDEIVYEYNPNSANQPTTAIQPTTPSKPEYREIVGDPKEGEFYYNRTTTTNDFGNTTERYEKFELIDIRIESSNRNSGLGGLGGYGSFDKIFYTVKYDNEEKSRVVQNMYINFYKKMEKGGGGGNQPKQNAATGNQDVKNTAFENHSKNTDVKSFIF
jgi:hypothetical protein